MSTQPFVITPRPLEVLGEHAAVLASSEVGSELFLKEGSRDSTSPRHRRPSERASTKTFSKMIHRLKEDVRSWYELHRRNGATNVVVWAIYLEQDGGEVYYTKHYQHFEYPGGASGATCGIGYDCGYKTHAQIHKDWDGIISDSQIFYLVAAAGLTGAKAQAYVQANGNAVTITWEQAMAEFMQRELPAQEAANRATLPNYDALAASETGCAPGAGAALDTRWSA
jgi:hypothetical protein